MGEAPSGEILTTEAGFGGNQAYLGILRIHPPDEEVCDGPLGGPAADVVGKQQNVDEPTDGKPEVYEDADRARPWDPSDGSGQSLPQNEVGAQSIPVARTTPAVGRMRLIPVVVIGHSGEPIDGDPVVIGVTFGHLPRTAGPGRTFSDDSRPDIRIGARSPIEHSHLRNTAFLDSVTVLIIADGEHTRWAR
ncbi:hypothetical protein ACWCPQ_33750 [Nocardia sp. NPDC001965]